MILLIYYRTYVTHVEGDKRRYKIEALSATHCGKEHDKKIHDSCGMRAPPKVHQYADSAYEGTVLRTLHKKPKNQKLTKKQKKNTTEPTAAKESTQSMPLGK